MERLVHMRISTFRTLDQDVGFAVRGEIEFEAVSGKRCSIADYIVEMSITWNVHAFNPWLYITGWMAMVQFRPGPLPPSNVWRPEVLDRPGKLLRTAAVMNIALPQEPRWHSSRLLNGLWPLLLFVSREREMSEGKGLITGIVLKATENGAFLRLGVLQSVQYEPLIKTERNTAQIQREQ